MTAHDMPTCGNPLPCKWAVRYAALERDHLKKWEQIDALQRERDMWKARAEAQEAQAS